jgi:hypothetical protein
LNYFEFQYCIESDKKGGDEKQSKGKDAAPGSKPGAEEGKLAAPADKKDATALSMQSGMSTSMADETSEDEEAKRKEAEKAAKKATRGISEKELEADVDVVIEETETIFLLHIPSQVVAA